METTRLSNSVAGFFDGEFRAAIGREVMRRHDRGRY